MLDEVIEKAIATGQPIEFTKEDLENKQYRLVGWTSIEIEREINRLSQYGYVPTWGISCTYTSHWLVYAQLMENLYYNHTPDETQASDEGSWYPDLWSADGGRLPDDSWASEEGSSTQDWLLSWEISD